MQAVGVVGHGDGGYGPALDAAAEQAEEHGGCFVLVLWDETWWCLRVGGERMLGVGHNCVRGGLAERKAHGRGRGGHVRVIGCQGNVGELLRIARDKL